MSGMRPPRSWRSARAMRVYERSHISNVLERLEGDKRAAAELLGISLSSLYRKIDELGLGSDSDA